MTNQHKPLTSAEQKARLDKATDAQKAADDAARKKERAQPAADTSNPTVALTVNPMQTKDGEKSAAREPMAHLPPNHTYRDRVVAQADSLGIETNDDMTLEYIMWLIRMKASS